LINLQWQDNSTDETGFAIERSTDGVNFTPLSSVAANSLAYDDLTVLGGYTYTYRVAAFNANGTSAFAVSNSVLVPPDATPPAAPSNLAVTNLAQTTLTLTWTDNANNETGFTIDRSTRADFSRNLVSVNVGPNITSYDVTGLTKNTKYFFRVRAFNVNFTSPWTPTLNVTTLK
jgi:titin